jgi:hypothetical protein
MNERREDLSTADLAGQQPTGTAPPDRAGASDVRQRDLTDDEPGREDVAAEERSRDTTVVEERRPDQEPAATPVDVAAAQTAPDGGTGGTGGAVSTTGPLLAADDAEGFRARWTDIQTGFVDEPRRAVEQADALVAELMKHLASTFADERGRLERQWDRGDDVPTDHLRDAFQRYRSFFERLLAT